MTFGDSTLHKPVASEEPTGSGLHLGLYMEGLRGKNVVFPFVVVCLWVFFFPDSRKMSVQQDITLLVTWVDS